jgi:DNA-binding NtrC family response regulator
MISSPFAYQNHNILNRSHLTKVEKFSKSIIMQDIFNKVLHLAKSNDTVIIVGEGGAGKKRLAKIIHQNSGRSQNPFYSFYCVDVKEEEYKEVFREHLHLEEDFLILKYDALEEARGGSLYLDQFSELPIQFMYNIIQSFVKGSEQLYRHNAAEKPRLLITMNLQAYQNIFYTSIWNKILRLINPIAVMVPPLRERKEDLPLIIDHTIHDIKNKREEWENLKISSQALQKCLDYSWPGNIRQLKNALLQGAILSHGETIKNQHLPFSMSWQLPYALDNNKKIGR